MKRILLLAGILALAASVPALAQDDQMNQGTQSQGTMSGTTVTGTVVSSANNQLIITTDNGDRMTFQVQNQSDLPSNLQAGQRVRVSYNTTGGGTYQIANVTHLDTGAGGTSGTMTQQDRTTTTPQDRSTMTQQDRTTGTMDQRGTTTTTTSDSWDTQQGRLPGTASPLPLIGGLGALSLAAGYALRRIRSR